MAKLIKQYKDLIKWNICPCNKIKYFMQKIRLKEITSYVRDLLEPHTSVENSSHVGSGVGRAMQVPSSFILCSSGVSRSPAPPRVFVLRSSLELSVNIFSRGSFFSPQSLAGSQTWVSSTTRGQRIYIQGVGTKVGATWELIRGWDILVRPSQLAEPIFSQPPLLVGFSPVYKWGRHELSFYRDTGFELVPRILRYSQTHPDTC